MAMNNLSLIQIPVYSHCAYPLQILNVPFSNTISEAYSLLVPMELIQKEFNLLISLTILPTKPQLSYRKSLQNFKMCKTAE